MKDISTATDLRGELEHAFICYTFYSGVQAARDTLEELGYHYVTTSGADVRDEWIVYERDATFFCLNRGTDEVTDWFTNLHAGKVSTPWGRIHKGFYESFDYVSYKLNWLRGKRVVYLGHSKGAAISAICASAYGRKGETFGLFWGMPKVGNKTFADIFNARANAKRIVHTLDVVPWTPFFNYWHVSGLVKRRFSSRLLAQHNMKNYVLSHPMYCEDEAPSHVRALVK